MPTESWSTPLLTDKSTRWKTRSRTWVRTPNYRTIPKSKLPINPYTDSVQILTQASRAESFWIKGSTGVKTTASPAGLLLTGADISAMCDAAVAASNYQAGVAGLDNSNLIKALGKASDAKVNLAVSLAEAGKTLEMVLSAAKRIDQAYRAFRRARFGDVARLLGLSSKTVHKTWLEYKYGWMPTLMDVHGAAEALAQQHVGRPPAFSVSSTSVMPIKWSRVTSYAAYGGGTATYLETLTGEYRVKHKLTCEVVNSRYATAQQLGLTNPALFVWELIPFSFVFDWFISVGDYLGAVTALDGLNVRQAMYDGVVNVDYEYSQPETTRFQGVAPMDMYFNASFNCAVPMRRYYVRSPFTPSVASLYPPRNIKPLSWQKCITGLALLRANINRV